MTIMPLISIIVPIYKVEKYLRRCLESILQQTYTNLEIILVDDGSPDGCPKICDEYAINDTRVKVIHKTNGGLSSARNAGLDIATGEWIGFVDSDDWILPNMYEKLYSVAKRESSDLVICGYRFVDESNTPVGDKFSIIKDEMLTKLDAFNKLSVRDSWFYITVVNKIYANRIFSNLRFPVGRIQEDEFTIHYVFDACEKIVSISDILYMYVQRKDSIMGKAFSINRFDGFDAFYDRYKFFRTKGLNKQARLSLRGVYAVVLAGIRKLDCEIHQQTVKPYYKRTFWLLLKARDLRVVKLFIFYQRNGIFILLKYLKKHFLSSKKEVS